MHPSILQLVRLKHWLSLLMLASTTYAMAQTEPESSRKTEALEKHRITILMANAFIPAADNIAGQNNFFIVPAWGFNYDYWLSHTIALGIHNTLILQQYKIEESSEKKIVERSFPVVISGEVLLKPWKNLIVSVGAGRELEKHESYTVVNTGIEYGVELQRGWELSFTLLYDNKIDAYDSWMVGVGFSKHVSKR